MSAITPRTTVAVQYLHVIRDIQPKYPNQLNLSYDQLNDN